MYTDFFFFFFFLSQYIVGRYHPWWTLDSMPFLGPCIRKGYQRACLCGSTLLYSILFYSSSQ